MSQRASVFGAPFSSDQSLLSCGLAIESKYSESFGMKCIPYRQRKVVLILGLPSRKLTRQYYSNQLDKQIDQPLHFDFEIYRVKNVYLIESRSRYSSSIAHGPILKCFGFVVICSSFFVFCAINSRVYESGTDSHGTFSPDRTHKYLPCVHERICAAGRPNFQVILSQLNV